MLITSYELINSGVPMSDDIRQEEIDFAIKTVELTYLKPIVTPDYYSTLTTSTLSDDDYKVVNGDGSVAGLKDALCHLVWAYLTYDRLRLTRYSTVIKDDEHSTDPSEDEIMSLCSLHWEIGLTMVIDALTAYDHEPSSEITPQPPFFELAFPIYRKPKHNN